MEVWQSALECPITKSARYEATYLDTIGVESVMKVFVTGHKGYIGSHWWIFFKQAGHSVTGCDLGLFEGCGWEDLVRPDRELYKDVRLLSPRGYRRA